MPVCKNCGQSFSNRGIRNHESRCTVNPVTMPRKAPISYKTIKPIESSPVVSGGSVSVSVPTYSCPMCGDKLIYVSGDWLTEDRIVCFNLDCDSHSMKYRLDRIMGNVKYRTVLNTLRREEKAKKKDVPIIDSGAKKENKKGFLDSLLSFEF